MFGRNKFVLLFGENIKQHTEELENTSRKDAKMPYVVHIFNVFKLVEYNTNRISEPSC